ncbi:MAG: DUF927 domain-containing protein [Rickettsiales bacterium]
MTKDPFAPLPPDAKGDNVVSLRKSDTDKDGRQIVPDQESLPPLIRHPKLGMPNASYAYCTAEGKTIFYVCRFDLPPRADGKKRKEILPYTFRELPGGKREWRWKWGDAPRPLYRLDALARTKEDAPLLIVEGEKKADAAAMLFPDFAVLASSGGSGSASQSDWTPCRGRTVHIWPDADEPGKKYAHAVALLASEAGAAAVRVVTPPEGVPEKWDLANALAEGETAESLRPHIEAAKSFIRETELAHGFFLEGGALWVRHINANGKEKPRRLCSALRVVAYARDEAGGNWGRLVEWEDADRRIRRRVLPMESLGVREGEELYRLLLHYGLVPYDARNAKRLIASYIAECRPYRRVVVATRTGWHGESYVFPDGPYPDNPDLLLQSTEESDGVSAVSGTLAEWRDAIGIYARGNSRVTLALCAAFAPALLALVDAENSGFHLIGKSSVGKTSGLRAAASVWGRDYIRRWRATGNGLENLAESRNDALLCLDELGQANAREAGEIAYMLGNGEGKTRMKDTGGARRRRRWRTVFLSTGEITLEQKIREGGGRYMAGMENRFVEIPADTGAHGLFENLHGFADGAALSRHIAEAAESCCGTPIRAFVAYLGRCDKPRLRENVELLRQDFAAAVLPADADAATKRVADRFGFLYAAGWIAHTADALPVDLVGIKEALAHCFRDWLKRRGTAGDAETYRAVREIVAFFKMRAHGAFAEINRNEIVVKEVQGNVKMAGYKKRYDEDGRIEYWMHGEYFRDELCQGRNPRAILAALASQGLIMRDSKGGYTRTEHLPKGCDKKQARFYVFPAAALENAETEEESEIP